MLFDDPSAKKIQTYNRLTTLSSGSLLNLNIVSDNEAALWRDKLALLAAYIMCFADVSYGSGDDIICSESNCN